MPVDPLFKEVGEKINRLLQRAYKMESGLSPYTAVDGHNLRT